MKHMSLLFVNQMSTSQFPFFYLSILFKHTLGSHTGLTVPQGTLPTWYITPPRCTRWSMSSGLQFSTAWWKIFLGLISTDSRSKSVWALWYFSNWINLIFSNVYDIKQVRAEYKFRPGLYNKKTNSINDLWIMVEFRLQTV